MITEIAPRDIPAVSPLGDRPMRILVTNCVTLNGGDAAIAHGIAKIVRNAFGADTELVFYDTFAEVAARYQPQLTYRPAIHLRATRAPDLKLVGPPIARLNAARYRAALALRRRRAVWPADCLSTSGERRDLQHYRDADLIISTGGTYLVENYPLGTRLIDFQLGLDSGTPLALFTQSLGPFERRANQRALARMLPRALLVLLRDERSLRCVQALGATTVNALVAGDAAFALADADRLRAAARAEVSTVSRVAISVRRWPYFHGVAPAEGMRRFVDAIVALTDHIVRRRGCEVVFVSTCQGVAEYRFDDSMLAAEIAARLPSDVSSHVRVDREHRSPAALIDFLSGFDVAVATRMHAGILALCAGTPVLPIAYEFKTHELFKRLGASDHVLDIETLNAGRANAGFDAFCAALPLLRPALFARAELERRSALESGRLLRQAWERRAA